MYIVLRCQHLKWCFIIAKTLEIKGEHKVLSKKREATRRSSGVLEPRQRETWEHPVIYFFHMNFYKLFAYSSKFNIERVISPNCIKFTFSIATRLHVLWHTHTHTDFISPCNTQMIQSDPNVAKTQSSIQALSRISSTRTNPVNSSWGEIKLRTLRCKPVLSHLSCSPNTVHMLRAESALCSQEVQDHLALFNDLENTHTGKSAVLGENKSIYTLQCFTLIVKKQAGWRNCIMNSYNKKRNVLVLVIKSTFVHSHRITGLTSMCKFGPNMCSTTLLWISQSASSLAMDLEGRNRTELSV